MRCEKEQDFPLSRSLSLFFVELAGVEPASKHGDHMLSTCLVLLDFRDRPAAEQPNLPLSPVISPSDRRDHPTSPGLRAPPYRVGTGPYRPGDVSSRHMCRENPPKRGLLKLLLFA
jgi:hypothetical protein